MFKRFYFVLAIGAALACNAAPSKPVKVPGSKNLEPTEQQSMVCKTVANFISKYNYKKVELNDSLSAVIYTRYIKSLDEGHNYLLASDIKDFDKYKNSLSDDIKNGNLNDVYYMFNVFQKRYEERINYSIAQLDKNFDFTKNESFTYDRADLPWVASEADMNAEWTKRVKYDLLNLTLASNDMAKNKEKLKKRYQDLLVQNGKLNTNDVFQIFMDDFTEAIDPHTNYFDPFHAAQFNMEMSRSLQGIGATLSSKNEYISIESLVAGGPADKSHQVNTGDRILAVAQGKDGEFQDIVGWRIDNAIKLIRGTKGTVVKLKILPQGKAVSDQPKIVELVREKIVLKDQLVKQEIKTYNSNGKTLKIGIINVPAFYADFNAFRAGDPNYQSTTRDMKLILDTLKRANVDGIVIDLRENGGGSLNEAISLTGLFIKTGPVVQVRDTQEQIDVNKDEDPSVAYSGPLAVLVDRFSASASEIFAGAIQDYGRGLILGTQTYGKGTVQSEIDLDKVITPSIAEKLGLTANSSKKPVSTGSENTFGQLNLTIAKFYRISGSSTQHKGVIPDIQFPSLIPMDKYGEDTDPSALPFDVIPKSEYTKAGDFTAALPQLAKLHEQRINNSASYKAFMQTINDYRKSEKEKSVTLNEQQLKKQREEDELKTLNRDNDLRVALGYKPLKKGEAKPKKEDLDPLKIEAGQILIDYINLDTKVTRIGTPAKTF
ncbi:carboxy terminal-processing peptidase [Mucilaginibacter sp. UR6-11]|uniref:carboxy terminal-processing peptidase n=1 Tax=Mucilaginibacter sp. UR6-11 TaxID=1435644 RepID=UPI001E37F3B8|nr:carboxy terminal-processing peptidase [Mucilaginibacter sp. UR6-11]MCC8424960.1 carboxy terminal-processing peptidase [Mucilaginibacter sp. UR6-11]